MTFKAGQHKRETTAIEKKFHAKSDESQYQNFRKF